MRWDVRREASFGVYPYQGMEQYNDLDTASTDFSEFPLLAEIMLGKDPNSPSAEVYDESDIETSKANSLFLIWFSMLTHLSLLHYEIS